MATSSPKAAKTATPKTPAPAAAKKASATKPARKTAAAAQPAEPVAATAAPGAVVAPAAKKAPKAAAKTPAKVASKPAGQPTLKQAAAKAAPAVTAAPEPAPAKKAAAEATAKTAAKTAAKKAAKKAANQAGQVAAAVVAVAEPVAEPPAAPRAAARKTRAASAVPKAAAPAQGAETAAAASPAAKPKAAPKPAGKVAGKTAAKTAGKAAAKKVATEAPANTPTPTLTPAVDVAGSAVAAATPKAPPRTAAKRPARSTEARTEPVAPAVAPAPAVEPPAPQPVNEPEAPQADAAIASAADVPAADAPAPTEPPQGGARTGGRSRGERGGRGRRDGRGERDNRDAAGGRATGDGGAGGAVGGGAEAGAAERDKPVGDAPGGERRDGRPAAGNRPRRPEPMSLDERAARSKQAMALAEAETANPTPAAPDAAEGEHAAPSPAAAATEQRDGQEHDGDHDRDRERGQRRGRGRGRDRDRPSAPPPAGAPAADAQPTTGANATPAAPAAPATVYRLPADPETAAADEALGAPDAPDTPSTPAQPQRPARPRPSPTGPAHSALVVVETADQRHIAWQPGHTCPEALDDALHDRLDASGHLAPDDDGALPLLLRLAKDAGHSVQIDPALWPLLGANRDARTRLHVLEAAYPDGAASAGLATLLRAPLPAYQADGALFAVVAGRLLMADERGLGKGVQAMAAAELWHRHFGVQRVLVLCTGDQRLAWQRAWWRFAGRSAQLVEGNANARQALWGQDADLRILSPDVLASDATALANWSPELVIVDEPQRLDGGWRHLDTPLALVLCGAALDTQPDLLDALVAWLDDQRQGPLAAVRRIRAAHDSGEVLDDNAIEQISDTLSRVMLQRQRAEVAEQLPPRVLGVRQVPLAAPQREAHAAHLATVQRLVAGWRRSGYLSDSDQWRLGQALAAAQTACHRANPADAGSPLAEATVATLDAQLADWGDTGYPMVAVLCASPADRDQLAAHFGESPGLVLCLPGEPLPEGTEVVLRIGVPWRLKSGPRTLDAVPGMPWVHLVGQASLELGLADTLAQRADVPAGLAEAGGRGYLSGAKLDAWLQAIDAALAAMAPPVGAVSSA